MCVERLGSFMEAAEPSSNFQYVLILGYRVCGPSEDCSNLSTYEHWKFHVYTSEAVPGLGKWVRILTLAPSDQYGVP